MNKLQYTFLTAIICCLLLTGCDKYLDITPKGKSLLTTVTDYDQWLNDPVLSYGLGNPSFAVNYFGDNVDVTNLSSIPVTLGELIYTWAPQFSTDLKTTPLNWGFHYEVINKFNTVLNGIDDATGGTSSQKRSLKAEALLGRALEYFGLVNEYGNAYDSATANSDLAVPFVTSNDVAQTVPPRSSVAVIYNHIIEDLNAALPDLPEDNSGNRYRGSKAAAYSLLARTYFYARNYTDARKNAELALKNTRAVMIDYNSTLPSTAGLFSVKPDVIYGRYLETILTPTLDFMRTFASNDLRVKKFFISTDNFTYTARGGTTFYPTTATPYLKFINTGTSVPEMILIAAEGAARNNDLPAALQQLDNIRKYRFATASYVPYQSTNQDSVLQAVFQERSHELIYNELRWFDMRRLDKENRMDTIKRYDAQKNVVATLSPHSPHYTLQIPIQVLNFNPDMPQNPY